MNQLKWVPKDPEKNIGVPGKGFISAADFCQEDLDNLIARAKNRAMDVPTFLAKAGLIPVKPQLEIELDPREFEKESVVKDEEINAHAEPKERKPRKPKNAENNPE